ncbi:MAG: hypothetical protein IKS10_05595 [Lachnospiraceae bacterium]|nr:hypothetical protein [Lachnospiraceae bacterium]
MKRNNVAKRLLAAALSAVMSVTLLPFGGNGTQVEAAATKKVASLNTDAIGFPVAPQEGDTGWKGSYVWYGKYDGKPVKYRVLQPYSFDYGSKAMFLDCDTILFMDKYDADGEPANASTTANGWDYSELRGKLNGAYFLDDLNNFTSAEKNALTLSRRESHPLVQGVNPYQVDSWTKQEFVNYVGLPHESVFLLDAEEVSNTAYGYPNSFIRHPARVKKYEGKDEEWVLRSASKNTDSVNTGLIGYLFPHGELDAGSVRATYGVSPAFNVNTNLVLFTSVVKGTAGAVGSEYKLTVIDKIMTAYAESNTMLSDGTISFNYCVNGEHFGNATQLSYLILDKRYTSSNQNGAKILYYGKMDTGSSAKLPQRGTASFQLPADLNYDQWNRTYFIYFFAEDINGEHETDYASVPFEISKPSLKTTAPTITSQPQDKTVNAGSTAAFSVRATGEGTISYKWQSRKNADAEWVDSGQSGAKTANLSVNAIAGLNGWQFRCIVRNANGQTSVSKTVTLTVNPVITTQPKNTEAVAGTVAKFTVAVNAKAPVSYQWQSRRNSSSSWSNSGQSGARTATLSVNALAGLNGWQFRCVVKDGYGNTLNSNAATLSVVSMKIKTQPSNASATVGSVAKFTVAVEGNGTLSYQWQSRKDSSSAWTNSGQSGARSATLSVNAVNGLSGWQFRCIIKDTHGNQVVSNAATITVSLGAAPAITTQPANKTVSAGTVAKFTVAASGTGTLTYQWQSRKNSSASWSNSGQSGAKTANLSVNAIAGLDGWQFRCIIKDTFGRQVISNTVYIGVN